MPTPRASGHNVLNAGQIAYDGNQTVYITSFEQPKGSRAHISRDLATWLMEINTLYLAAKKLRQEIGVRRWLSRTSK